MLQVRSLSLRATGQGWVLPRLTAGRFAWMAPTTVLALASAFTLIGIAHPLRNVNEGIYARIAQEMLERGSWLVPTVNAVPYLEKPPLLYWVTRIAFALFGISEASARAAPVLGAILAITASFEFARRHLSRDSAIIAALMVATAPVMMAMSRVLLFDMLLTGLVALGVNEHVMRFLDRRIPHDYHTGPWWYYLPRVVSYTFPWILLAFVPTTSDDRTRTDASSARRLLWIAFLAPLVLFSLSGAKGDYYMVVGTPALLILIADRVARAPRGCRMLAIVPVTWLAVLAWFSASAAGLLVPYTMPPHAAVCVSVATAFAGLGIVAARRSRVASMVALCALAMMPGALVFAGFIESNEAWKSSRALAAAVRETGIPAVYVYRRYDDLSALAFYLDSPVGVVASRSADLWYGLQLEPDADRFPTLPALVVQASAAPVVLVVMDSDWNGFLHSALADMLRYRGRVGRCRIFTSVPVSPGQLAHRSTTWNAAERAASRG